MYHYETLGDERFQELCQALLVKEFPNTQCLPVGQPDGGRDAYLIRHLLNEMRLNNSKSDLTVFQVKYIKNAQDSRSEREMIEEIVKLEKPKIDRLRSAGLKRYYLLTNVKGTSHLDVGSIDKVNSQLSALLGIEAYCWWRDDLDRRIDGNSSVKWSYSEILRATDLLEALVSGHLGEFEERRRSAIRAYMTSQYEDDQVLKFKQTELRSTLTDLFVDLPMRRAPELLEISHARGIVTSRRKLTPSTHLWHHNIYIGHGDDSYNSAEHFLNENPADHLSRIVLEGAPGQGKSTVTQFACQILRMHLLDKSNETARLPKQFRNIPLRIPFRVDLRDLAKWIDGVDPFQSKPVDIDDKEPRSLEGFLAAQIRFASGGHDFNVSDLTAVARASHILLALDGFDEVADISLRDKLVTEITRGSNRLIHAGDFSVQTIVTSRPAAFAKSIRFPRDQWSYFELLALERKQVDEYTVKWMSAKGLNGAEKIQLSRILDNKLQEAHTQFLAKNPMQLTILLSLIHNRGASLPEKRTAMYDAYMDMFFSRESEKSDIVRDNRDLLIDIHRFLAWKLQTAAEAGENGSIEHSALRSTLLVYLDSQGEDTSIVSDLFNGIVERVGALVSRVQETYEFEVQPLREYFAARHLYDTAPYSPAGAERTGTKLDRFDALVRNPYWLNVARFYGGCFSKGEISALVDQLSELAECGPYRLTSHPRSVAFMLLGDWVFTQYQPAVRKIVALIGDHPGLRQLLASNDQSGTISPSALPDRSGRGDFVDILWTRAGETCPPDELAAISTTIVRNSPVEERTVRWRAMRDNMSEAAWLRLGGAIRVFEQLSNAEILSLAPEAYDALVQVLIEAGRLEFSDADGHVDRAKLAILHKIRLATYPGTREGSLGRLGLIATMLGHFQYGVALQNDATPTLRSTLERRISFQRSDRSRLNSDATGAPQLAGLEKQAFEAYQQFLNTSTAVTSSSLEPWRDLVEALRAAFGDCAAIDRIALFGAGVRSRVFAGEVGPLKSTSDLVGAARFVRLKSGAPRWWQERFQTEDDSQELDRLLSILWMWGTPRTILQISNTLKGVLESMSDDRWERLYRDNSSFFFKPGDGNEVNLNSSEILAAESQGIRYSTFIGMRLSLKSRLPLATSIAEAKASSFPETQFAFDALLASCRVTGQWEYLEMLKSLYSRGALPSYAPPREDAAMPEHTAELIASDAASFPLALLAAADARLRSSAGSSAAKMLDIANTDRWFA